ncbi:MAG TPA: hypothetical protein VFV10_15300 [Gammaproteobacteria bacterium]|nr:hypothetical protein [Gammaproteobacteria bacterium]
MSAFVRFGFTGLIVLYSLYLVRNDHVVAGIVGLVLAAGFFLLGRSR